MRVEQVITSDNKIRYMLIDQHGEIVLPVMKFLKYKDHTGTARNTLRSYCYALKLYFEFLEQKSMSYTDVGIDELAEFVRWLQSPFHDESLTIYRSHCSTCQEMDSMKLLSFHLV